MSRVTRLAAFAVALGSMSGALAACQSLAGIEDRTYVQSEAGAAGTRSNAGDSQECIDYCQKAETICKTDLDGNVVPGGALYLSNEACRATCKALLSADATSIACRMRQLSFVDTGEEVQSYCAAAGPGGNGPCGSNCENYCRLFKTACRDEFEKYSPVTQDDDGIALCVNKCLGLTDTGLFSSTQKAGNYFGDTVQCRLVHTCSSMLDPDTHCSHATFKPTDKCLDDPTAEPDCKKFCRLEMAACVDADGEPNIYQSEAQCEAVCKALPRGQIGDTAINTVGCRMYHSYNSLLDPMTHCSHTGPGGDGHCLTGDDLDAGNCESYCGLLEQACKDEFADKFDDQSACQAACVKLDGSAANSGYTTAAKGNNLQCRLLYVSRALTNKKECAAALGSAAPCK